MLSKREKLGMISTKYEGAPFSEESLVDLITDVSEELCVQVDGWTVHYHSKGASVLNKKGATVIDVEVPNVAEKAGEGVNLIISRVVPDYNLLSGDSRNVEDILRSILTSRKLEDLCEYLDTCFDLYDLGYIDSMKEQEVLNALAESNAVQLWAIHRYANTGDVNMEHTFYEYVKYLFNKVEVGD